MNPTNPSSESPDDPGDPRMAVALSFVAPGLGLAYVGRLVSGLVVNLAFILAVLLFVVASATLQFFPGFPAVVLIGAWILVCGLSGWRAADLIRDGDSRRSRTYQHPLIYVLIAVLTFGAPLAVIGHFTERHLLTVVSVDDESMAPRVRAGESVLVDRTGFQDQAPTRGDLIAVVPPETDDPIVVRVVGLPSDRVRMHGYSLAIDDELVTHRSVDDADIGADDPAPDLGLELWIEDNLQTRYVVATTPGTALDTTIPEFEVETDEYFVLSDHRSFTDDDTSRPVDSRSVGTVHRQHLVGRPLYIGWSDDPDTVGPRFDRIGLPLE